MSASLRYSCAYFAYNLANAVTVVYFPLHAKALGFSPFEIALSAAVANLATLLGAPGFSTLSYFRLAPRTVLRRCALIAACCYLPLLFVSSFPWVMTFWSAFLVFNAGTLVMIDARAVRESSEGLIRFEQVRLWGSIGFLVSIAVVGLAIDVIGVQSIVLAGTIFVLATAAAGLALLPRLAESPGRDREPAAKARERAPINNIALILVAVALIWASHSAYYTYFTIYVRALGWSGTMISVAWNLGVAAEIGIFLLFRSLAARFSLVSMLRLSAALTVLRWAVIAHTASTEMLVVVQVLHAFSFGVFYLASIRLVQERLPAHFKERGQGLLSGFGSGAGSLAGRIGFGALASQLGGPEAYAELFSYSAAFAFLALLTTLCIPVTLDSRAPDREQRL